ncbi:YeeE/YedE thiosulfate transporter family protein [Piscinibacter sakaiensis]|uniref:YeeE/YedE thiosulfate transporter family protein n=1 Tax=Piscinibacter sakaiensis TaxID=1547922 RepID=UPI003AAEF762
MQEDGGAWSAYLVGALIGVLSMATFYFSNKPLGVSTAYLRVAGMISRLISKSHTDSLKQYQDTPPKIEWEVMLMVGIVLGALLAAFTGGEVTGSWVPDLWAERFGDSFGFRQLVAFIGGAVMVFGARLAGGCTSGHGISGTLQLSVGSWIAVICFFVGGAAVAMLMFGVGGVR